MAQRQLEIKKHKSSLIDMHSEIDKLRSKYEENKNTPVVMQKIKGLAATRGKLARACDTLKIEEVNLRADIATF